MKSKTPFRVVIPARYASSRFPGKPLVDLAGKPMIARVIERARRSHAAEIIVATDDERIAQAARTEGCPSVLTSAAHASGTDRLAEVVCLQGWGDGEIVVNVQGDEPLIDPALIDAVAEALAADEEAAIATAACPIVEPDDFFSPQVVKVVVDGRGRALYFSRAPIPWHRDGFASQSRRFPASFAPLRHIGIYAYRAGFLRRFTTLSPAPLEQWEALEQLRALWHGYSIRVAHWRQIALPGVDTPEDLARVRACFAAVH